VSERTEQPMVDLSRERAREQLRQLLVEKGFLVTSKTTRLVSRSGRPMAWMLYSPAITLTSEGSLLAGRCLLQSLGAFRASQLATYGYTGLPLMMATLYLGQGHYRGLVVEDKPDSATEGVVQGNGRRPGPVVVVDDSLVSGTSFFRAARVLEEEGFQVEGLLCLVEFPGRGGRAAAEAAGYRVQAVFELERDLEIHRLAEQDSRLAASRAAARAGEPMDPVTLVRSAVEAWPGEDQTAGESACPHDPPAHTGVLVELRERSGRLIAREGFVAPAGPPLCCTAEAQRAVKAILQRSSDPARKFGKDRAFAAIRLLSQAEEIAPSQIDAQGDALLVQSRQHPSRVGFTLRDGRNRTEIALYLAARQMAGLGPAEPHAIYRCSQQELVEPCTVQLTLHQSSPVQLSQAELATLVHIARDAICAQPSTLGSGAETALDGLRFSGAGIAWYQAGRLLGCWLSWNSSLSIAVRRAAAQAWQLGNLPQTSQEALRNFSVLLTLLDRPRPLGELTAVAVAGAFDLGREALVASAGKRSAAVFPHFVCHHGWSARQTAEMALRKANIAPTATAAWVAYRANSWLIGEKPDGDTPGGEDKPVLLQHGFPRRSPSPRFTTDSIRQSAAEIADYLATQINADGLPAYLYDPVDDVSVRVGSIGRIIFALDALCEAGAALHNERWAEMGSNGLQRCLDRLEVVGGQLRMDLEGFSGSSAAFCELLAALACWLRPSLQNPSAVALARQVHGLFKPDGMISEVAEGFRMGTDPDILPGVALVAVGRYAQHTGVGCEMPALETQLAWYRRRFRLCRPWAMIGWQMQGWSVINEIAAAPGAVDFVFEMADWAIHSQLDSNGAFLTDLALVEPGFHTAYVAEGIAAAWRQALCRGHRKRADHYAGSWMRSMQFMDTLVLRPTDCPLLPNPAKALGGVRASAIDARLRVDYAAHHLRALVRGMMLMECREFPG
jgi:orotate phosphoribosyltransferase